LSWVVYVYTVERTQVYLILNLMCKEEGRPAALGPYPVVKQ
jgi:hypothetical protein